MTTPALDLSAARRVLVAGDWHADTQAAYDAIEVATRLQVDVLLQVGDFGIGPWGRESRDPLLPQVESALARARLPLLVTPGNHENWDSIGVMPLDDAGMYAPTDHIRVLPRGLRFRVGSRVFGSLGGADTIDRHRRIPHLSWWPQELPTRTDLERLGRDQLDVLICHDVPAGVALHLQAPLTWDADRVRHLLADAVAVTRPAWVFCGHWHQRVSHMLRGLDGQTRVEVLDRERRPGNLLGFDVDEMMVFEPGDAASLR